MAAAKRTVPEDLQRLMRYLPESDAAEREAFLAAADDFLGSAAPGDLSEFGPLTRVKLWLAKEHRLEDLQAVIRYERDNPKAHLVRGRLSPHIEVPGVASSSLPKEICRLQQRELPLDSQLTDLTWVEGRLRVRGYAYVRNVPMESRPRVPGLAWLTHTGSRRRIAIRLTPRREPRATSESKQALHCYDWAGFEFFVDPEKLRSGGSWTPGTWSLTLGVWGAGRLRRDGLPPGEVGTSGHPHARRLNASTRWVSSFRKKRLEFSIEPVTAELTGHSPADGMLALELRAPGADRLVVEHGKGEAAVELEYPLEGAGDGVRTVSVPLADLAVADSDDTRELRVHAVVDGSRAKVVVAPDVLARAYPFGEAREIAVGVSATQTLVVHDRLRQPVVDEVEWREGTLVLTGAYTGPDGERVLVLRHGERFEEVTVPVTIADGRFRAEIDPEGFDFYGDPLPLRKGRWYLTLRGAQEWDNAADIPVKLRPDLVERLPLKHHGHGRTFTVDRRFHDRVFLRSGNPLAEDERGAYRQRRIREEFLEEQRALPLREAVFYNSFGGKQYSDSPRAIHEELVRRGLDVEHLWSVNDQQVPLPPGVTPVEWRSREWYAALARSRYVVTNVGIGDWFVRREGQVIAQTWHGTPLKKIGADLLGTPKANRAYIASLPERSRQWDFFVSPNAFTTPIMRRAFRCEAEILESGYPRNDVFHAPDREERARRTRELLGIPEGKKVVLYAPTWRDDQRYDGTRFKLDLRIDLEAAQRDLGEDHVLLFRKHPKVLDSIPGAGQGFVWDVSKYPDIADLYLITDVLITDYSSVFFDFAHSGRPMLFFTYDLEHYRDTLRGFYFDLSSRAPGPLIKTSEELVKAIRDVDDVNERYRDQYEAFVRDFCEPSDGLATKRVVDRMLGTTD
ncbi:CDP-glycerol glycerophosphotransferase family protein [Nocardiopsis aegyptia]|uniref:CDP-glycerol glycerophosphotransferase n=1 Tax=Nocardiopsis aegyptia TaxID=220378 RepID=A0A7Z0EM35_9ACTN|nr:CDP-glycerol glycerophosphotransferase family protein [Nocardiopsis aegyptia]NYJ34389.1 CDP-glycerol glycerophosphotransferase [Nocardiopsis aegyptia]